MLLNMYVIVGVLKTGHFGGCHKCMVLYIYNIQILYNNYINNFEDSAEFAIVSLKLFLNNYKIILHYYTFINQLC